MSTGASTPTKRASGTKKIRQKLRYRFAAGAVAISAAFAAFVPATPVSAHEEHKNQYVYGNWDACPGDWQVPAWPQKFDYGWGHLGRTEAYISRGNHCLRAKTETWSDHGTNGYRQWVNFTIRDQYGADLMTTEARRFGVEGAWYKFHARTDYYVIDLPQWVADRADRIQINGWRN